MRRMLFGSASTLTPHFNGAEARRIPCTPTSCLRELDGRDGPFPFVGSDRDAQACISSAKHDGLANKSSGVEPDEFPDASRRHRRVLPSTSKLSLNWMSVPSMSFFRCALRSISGSFYGSSVRAAAERAKEARKQADRLAVDAWNKRMLGFKGPAQPSPTGYPWPF